MNVSSIIKILLKAILIPVFSALLLSKFNLSEYIPFVPEEYQYEIGLTVYLALIEAIYGFCESFFNSRKAKVICVFYKVKEDKDIENIPTIICDDTIGVSTINYYIELTGNLKRLRKCKFKMELPPWLTIQLNISDEVLSYKNNQLIWEFDKILPATGIKNQNANCQNKISLIKNISGNNVSLDLKPKMEKKIGICFATNGFKVKMECE